MGIRQTPDNNMATALRVVCVLASVVAIHGFTPSTMFGSRVVSHRPFLSKGPTMAVLKPEQIPFASSLGKKKIPDKKAWVNYGPKPEKGKAVGGPCSVWISASCKTRQESFTLWATKRPQRDSHWSSAKSIRKLVPLLIQPLERNSA